MAAKLVAQEPPAGQNAALQALDLSFMAGILRETGIQDSAAAVKLFFNDTAALRWQRISSEYSEEQLNDFFQGAMVVTDGKSASQCMLYNPWWDAALLLQASGLPEIPKVERFAFVSGVRFRGETDIPMEQLDGVVPQTEKPFAVELWSLMDKTTRYYLETYQNNSQRLFVRLQTTDAKDTERIQIRSGVRLKLWLRFMQNNSMQREARRIARYLTPGHEDKMQKYFTDGGAGFVKSFSQLPAEVRTRFVPYCYIPGKEGTLLLFCNPKLPRIVVTVTLPRKRLKHIMEWYDLAKAEEYLKLWQDAQKEVAE